MTFITEPARKIPVAAHADICVVGGSCTGVFAAVRAARLGARVALVEKQNCLGGTATSGLVNVWHSLYDSEGERQIIAGLTQETIERLDSAGALKRGPSPHNAFRFNSQELKIELDRYVAESKISLFLHTMYTGAVCNGGRVSAVFIENKDGRGAITADFFIDASGDGDVARDLNIPSYRQKGVQPPTACFLLNGRISAGEMDRLVFEHGGEFGLDDGWGWSDAAVCGGDITMRADNHVQGALCSRAGELTRAEVEGRRQMRAILSLLKKYAPEEEYALVAACSHIGVRDTVHY